jgi:hypothetical protein
MPTVVYNSYTLPNVYGPYTVAEDHEGYSFSCNFLLKGTSTANLVSLVNTAESKLDEINKDFSVTYDATSELNLSHSSNTGFLARPNISIIRNELSAGISRAYAFSIRIGKPFDQSSYNFRREGSFTISYGPSRQRSVSFRCLYTAGSSNSALDNYNGGSGGINWAEGVLTALGGTYEKINESIQEEHEEKILNASLLYKEILANQSSAGLNHVNIIDPQVNYSVDFQKTVGASDSTTLEAEPTVTVSCNFSCTIDRDQVSAEADLGDVYQDTVKPWLLQHARDILELASYSHAGTAYIIQSESHSVDPYNSRIAGRLVFTAPKTTTQILELTEKITISDDKGIVSEKLWDENDHTYNIWSVGATRRLTRLLVVSKLNIEQVAPPEYTDTSEGLWLLENRNVTTAVMDVGKYTTVGVSTPSLLNLFLWTTTFMETYLYVVPVTTVFGQPEA